MKKTHFWVLFSMASTEGFEPPTVRLEGACSIQLSYVDNLMLEYNSKLRIEMQDTIQNLLNFLKDQGNLSNSVKLLL